MVAWLPNNHLYTVQVKVCYSDVSIIQIFLFMFNLFLYRLQPGRIRRWTYAISWSSYRRWLQISTIRRRGSRRIPGQGRRRWRLQRRNVNFRISLVLLRLLTSPHEKASSFLNQKLRSNFSTFSFFEEKKIFFFAFHVKWCESVHIGQCVVCSGWNLIKNFDPRLLKLLEK